MINKQLFLSALLLLLSSLSLYSAELSELEIPNQPSLANDTATDAEWGWPEKFKMEYKFYIPFKGFFKFRMQGKTYSLDENKLVYIVSLADKKTKMSFIKATIVYLNRQDWRQKYSKSYVNRIFLAF
jgi:hypothetical protein